MRILTAATAIVLAVSAGAQGAVPDQQIGAAAKVVNSVYGTPEATHQPQWLRPGLDVFQNEMIVTAEDSASRMVFKDRTELAIGPVAQVKLDNFVFDPNPSASTVTVSMVKGVFRFTSGVLPKDKYEVKTPAAAIVVRGTVFTVAIFPAGNEIISVESGTIYVSCHVGVTTTVNAGQMIYINSPTSAASPAQPAIPVPAVGRMDALLR
jgi:hypothetical protein